MDLRCSVALFGCLVTLAAAADERLPESPRASPQVFTDEQSFLKAAAIEHTSDFENLPGPFLDHPLTFEKVTYAAWSEGRHGEKSGDLIVTRSLGKGRRLMNNSHPDLTLTFGKGRMVTAVGFYVLPTHKSAGDWEITLTGPMGKTFVESFSHKADLTAHYRGFIAPEGIVSVRVTRPKGRRSPNHAIDDVSRSAIVAVKHSSGVAAAEANSLGPLETVVRRRSGRTSSPLEAAVAGIWKDAGVGTDPKYAGLARIEARQSAVALVDMRRVLVYWQGAKMLRDWPQVLHFTCGNGRVVLSWRGELAAAVGCDQARERFHSALEWLGYREVKDREQVGSLAQRLGLTMEGVERWAHSTDYHVHSRKVGETEIAVFCESGGYTGGSKSRCGVDFQWFATRPYPLPQPTFGETLAVMPDWFQVPYLDRSFFVVTKREPIRACSAGRGLHVDFTEDVYKKLVDALEGDGFEYQRSHKPRRDGSVQQTWCRHADATYAHLTAFPDSTQTRFYCQPPQDSAPREAAGTSPP